MVGESRSKDDGSNDHSRLDNCASGNQVMVDWLDELFVYRGLS